MDTFGTDDLFHMIREAYGQVLRAPRSPDAGLWNLSFWVVCGDQRHPSGPVEVLRAGGDAPGAALAVFSFEEEAEAFLELRGCDQGLRVRELDGGELVSLLYGLWSGFSRVALDPVPEADCGAVDGIVTVSRKEFVRRILSRAQPVSSWPTRGVPVSGN